MIVLIMGVAGAGKSTVGAALAERLGAAFVDADDMHPVENVEKMRAGEPLTGADRLPWLRQVRQWLDARIAAGEPAVLACSALTRDSRVLLGTQRPQIELVLLEAGRELIAGRMRGRDHFMPVSLLESQFEALERPRDAIVVDAGLAVDAIVAIVHRQLI